MPWWCVPPPAIEGPAPPELRVDDAAPVVAGSRGRPTLMEVLRRRDPRAAIEGGGDIRREDEEAVVEGHGEDFDRVALWKAQRRLPRLLVPDRVKHQIQGRDSLGIHLRGYHFLAEALKAAADVGHKECAVQSVANELFKERAHCSSFCDVAARCEVDQRNFGKISKQLACAAWILPRERSVAFMDACAVAQRKGHVLMRLFFILLQVRRDDVEVHGKLVPSFFRVAMLQLRCRRRSEWCRNR